MEEHKISLSTAILLNMNIMIGSGILIGPGAAAAISGNASFLAWPVVALMFLPIVLSTIELSRLFPGAGGFYLYAKQGLNETAGFASGWLYIVGYTVAATVELMALQDILLKKFGPHSFLSHSILFYAIALTCVIAFSFLSLRIVSSFLNSLTLIKILPLLILILLLPFVINPSFSISAAEMSLLPASLTLPIFGYFGFEYCVGLSHLIKNSEKNAPLAILIGFIGTALLYTLFHFGALNLMGASNLAHLGAANFPTYITLPIPYLKTLLSLLIPTTAIIIFIASLIGMINANAILLNSMAQQHLFKSSFGTLLAPVAGNGRPWAALIIQGITVFIFAALLPSIDVAGGLCIFGVFSSFILPFISLWIVQARHGITSKLLITTTGLFFLLGFCVYSFTKLGTTLTECCLYSLLLLAAFALGMALFNKDRK